MRDIDIRTSLAELLRQEHPEHDTLFVDELDLAGKVRVDMAAVNGALWGYEIKSACDTLRRLPLQVEVYSRTLDRAALVVAERHQKQAVELLPTWWEVVVATPHSDGVTLTQVRDGASNPNVDPWSVVQLLWREEALEELAERGLDRGVRSKPRRAIWQRMVEQMELSTIRGAVRARLKSRTAWRAAR